MAFRLSKDRAVFERELKIAIVDFALAIEP